MSNIEHSFKQISRVVYRFFTPPLAGIGKLLALFGRYFGIGIGITVHAEEACAHRPVNH